MAAGCLIVVHKLLKTRKELCLDKKSNTIGDHITKVSVTDEELAKFDSDGEEKYEDITDSNDERKTINSVESSKVLPTESLGEISEINPSKYNPYHRVAAFAGAEFCLRNELILLQQHYHPTVKLFC